MNTELPPEEHFFSARSFVAAAFIHLVVSVLLAFVAFKVAFESPVRDSRGIVEHDFWMRLIELMGWIWTPLSVIAIYAGSFKESPVVAFLWSLGVGWVCGFIFNGRKRFSEGACTRGMLINFLGSVLLAGLRLWQIVEGFHTSTPWLDVVVSIAWIWNPVGATAFQRLNIDLLMPAVFISLGWSVLFGIACGIICARPVAHGNTGVRLP